MRTWAQYVPSGSFNLYSTTGSDRCRAFMFHNVCVCVCVKVILQSHYHAERHDSYCCAVREGGRPSENLFTAYPIIQRATDMLTESQWTLQSLGAKAILCCFSVQGATFKARHKSPSESDKTLTGSKKRSSVCDTGVQRSTVRIHKSVWRKSRAGRNFWVFLLKRLQ